MAQARSIDEPSKSAGNRSIDSGISPASSQLWECCCAGKMLSAANQQPAETLSPGTGHRHAASLASSSLITCHLYPQPKTLRYFILRLPFCLSLHINLRQHQDTSRRASMYCPSLRIPTPTSMCVRRRKTRHSSVRRLDAEKIRFILKPGRTPARLERSI
jgi:hypothetical protein